MDCPNHIRRIKSSIKKRIIVRRIVRSMFGEQTFTQLRTGFTARPNRLTRTEITEPSIYLPVSFSRDASGTLSSVFFHHHADLISSRNPAHQACRTAVTSATWLQRQSRDCLFHQMTRNNAARLAPGAQRRRLVWLFSLVTADVVLLCFCLSLALIPPA